MENTLTAKGYISKNLTDFWGDGVAQYTKEDVEKSMIEFAKMHVTAALKEASKKVEHTIDTDWVDFHDFSKGHNGINVIIDKDSILNSYPLENIK